MVTAWRDDGTVARVGDVVNNGVTGDDSESCRWCLLLVMVNDGVSDVKVDANDVMADRSVNDSYSDTR